MSQQHSTDPTKPVNQTTLDNAQSDIANQAMDGIQRTDINQDHATSNESNQTGDSLLDMLHDSKKVD